MKTTDTVAKMPQFEISRLNNAARLCFLEFGDAEFNLKSAIAANGFLPLKCPMDAREISARFPKELRGSDYFRWSAHGLSL